MDGAKKYSNRATVKLTGGRLLIALSCLIAGVAPAADRGTVVAAERTEIRLHFERRDLATPGGARHLLSRIRNAALETCGASEFSFPDYKAATLASPCFRDAVNDAVSRIDNPLLTAAASESRR